jgi:hypothetical protein
MKSRVKKQQDDGGNCCRLVIDIKLGINSFWREEDEKYTEQIDKS